MAAALRTHVGKVRKQNEDAAFFDEEQGVYAVADGMGGHQAGEVASAIAMDIIRKMAMTGGPASSAKLKAAVEYAHKAIWRHAQEHPECGGMGTTLSVMWRSGRYMYIAHVGDSRIYRLRGGQLEQITQDHSLVEELVRAGLITPEQARMHPRRNVITRALGTGGENAPDLLAADTQRGDVWLICSDGLNSMIPDIMIKAEMQRVQSAADLGAAADALIERALGAGGSDNVTLVLYLDEEA
ncbi:MAG: Stp1/IreP family PP2C-type Ser/Thr phosphatase [Clostridia bacterium]|nr:Stp1/IreP family PP2C-type Ser/Thr phosphatase [Clostridia bacterium]